MNEIVPALNIMLIICGIVMIISTYMIIRNNRVYKARMRNLDKFQAIWSKELKRVHKEIVESGATDISNKDKKKLDAFRNVNFSCVSYDEMIYSLKSVKELEKHHWFKIEMQLDKIELFND